MLIYLIIAIIIILYSFLGKVNKTNKRKKIYLFFCFGLLTIIAMLRNVSVGTDLFKIYAPIFERVKDLRINELSNINIEIGYVYLNKIIDMINPSVSTLIIVTSIVTIPMYGIFIYKNSEDVAISTMMYVLLNSFFMSLSMLRQGIAITIILIAYEYLKKDNIKKFIILILIATTIHASAIITLMFIPLKKACFTKKFFYISFFIIAMVVLLYKPIINIYSDITTALNLTTNKDYAEYVGTKNNGEGQINVLSITNFIMALSIYLLGYIYTKRQNMSQEEFFYMYCAFFYLLSITSTFVMGVIGRLSHYFLPFVLLLFSSIIKKIKNNKEKQLVFFVFFSYMLVKYLYVLFFLAKDLYGVTPYCFLWN